jgi:NAD(P)-dependent dehydrogenase (short-subunit alcohol dehydrogenase family)
MAVNQGPKTAIVTGGSKGFGRALVAELVRSGWEVIIDGRDVDLVGQTAAATGAVAVPGDVTDPSHRAQLIEMVHGSTGRLDLLVNNASTLGSSPLPPLARYDLDVLRHVYETNVVAPLGLAQVALPLLANSGGALLNVTSDAAVEAYEGWGGYGSSKAALEQLSNVLAAENPGVRVWWLDPGDMRTAMHQQAFPGEDISDRPAPEAVAPAVVRLVESRAPSGRVRVAELLPEASR